MASKWQHLLVSILSVLLLVSFSSCTSNEDKAKKAALEFLKNSHTDTSTKYEVASVDVMLDTIPEYFSEDVFLLANKAAVAYSSLHTMQNSFQQRMLAEKGSSTIYDTSRGRCLTPEDCHEDIILMQAKLDEVHKNVKPVIGYIVTIVENFQNPGDIQRESREVILVDKDDPSKVLKHWSFYGLQIDEITVIKLFQPYGEPCKTDVLGNVTKKEWYKVERFILNDNFDPTSLFN